MPMSSYLIKMYTLQVRLYIFYMNLENCICMFLGHSHNFYAISVLIKMLMETQQLTLQASVFSLGSFDKHDKITLDIASFFNCYSQ